MPTRNFVHVSARVFRELRRDYRTMTLFIISPALVQIVLYGMLSTHPDTYNRCGLIVMGLFPSAPTFLFAAFMVHRERHSGTMEHLLTTPVARADIVLGYIIGFTLPAIVQVAISFGITYGILGIDVAGPWWTIALLAMLNSVLGVGMGLFATNLVRTEFQLVLTLPVLGVPHLSLSGLFLAYDEMVGWQQAIATFLPWRYAVGALAELKDHATANATMLFNVAVTAGICLLLFTVAVQTVFRRRTA
jgi:ABC-2 type transport system permease protein